MKKGQCQRNELISSYLWKKIVYGKNWLCFIHCTFFLSVLHSKALWQSLACFDFFDIIMLLQNQGLTTSAREFFCYASGLHLRCNVDKAMCVDNVLGQIILLHLKNGKWLQETANNTQFLIHNVCHFTANYIIFTCYIIMLDGLRLHEMSNPSIKCPV